MLDEIEALAALSRFGTVSEAATRLRLTQSAVSKRLQALQDRVGFRLVEPDGRRLRLTARGLDFVERARPLVAELRALAERSEGTPAPRLSLALADSIASSWGPAIVRRALASLPGQELDLHAHRSVLVVESVRLGRYHVGLCTAPPPDRDLVLHPLISEPLVHVLSGLGPRRRKGADLIVIEPASATFRAVAPLLEAHYPELLARRLVSVESFGAAAQMIKAGFGDGLLPLGLALELRLPQRSYRVLPRALRHIALVTRKTVDQLASFQSLRAQLVIEARAHLAPPAPRGAREG